MKEKFKLEPGDILVNINDRSDPYSVIKRWALGNPYEHVFMYMGRLGLLRDGDSSDTWNVPMLFESNGRGVVLQSLSNRYGEKVVVLRARYNWVEAKLPYVLEEAIKLASEPQAYYDYLCIMKYVIPRLICEKLGLPLPIKYHRDSFHICSEAVFEVFYRAGLEEVLLPVCVPPLPGDFITDSVMLMAIGKVKLSEAVV